MKFLKNTMAIIAMLAIGSVSAKQVGKKTTTATTTTTPKPVITPTRPTGQSEQQIMNMIENYKKQEQQIIYNFLNQISINQNNFTTSFFNALKTAQLSADKKENLLKKAKETFNEKPEISEEQTLALDEKNKKNADDFNTKYYDAMNKIEEEMAQSAQK